jgi:hypothetical protein
MLMSRLRTSALLLLIAGAALSCAPDDRRDSPLAPDVTQTQTGNSDLLGIDLFGAKSVPQGDYVLIEERAPNLLESLQISRVIGILGGSLSLAGHTVTVPSGAVSLPTVFTLTLLPNGYIEVEVEALQTSLLGRLINVGEQGFRKPVDLTLTYSRATNVTDPSRLKLMRVNPDGKHEILPSTVDFGRKTVTAKLDHFSRYCMIAN